MEADLASETFGRGVEETREFGRNASPRNASHSLHRSRHRLVAAVDHMSETRHDELGCGCKKRHAFGLLRA
jgi:hypothetical protein